jgi:hypothetical protein
MSCRLITSPITGKEVTSKTWAEIRNTVNTDERADHLYEKLLSPKFLSWFGDWVNTPIAAGTHDTGEPTLSSLSAYQSRNTQYQLNNNEGKKVSGKTVRDLASRFSHRTGIAVKVIDDPNLLYKGRLTGDLAYINLAYATMDTPIHEILGHPFIAAIKKLGKERPEDKEFSERTSELFSQVYNDYLSEGLTDEEARTEARNIVYGPTKSYKLYENLLKELESGRGKEVFDRVSADYSNSQDRYVVRRGTEEDQWIIADTRYPTNEGISYYNEGEAREFALELNNNLLVDRYNVEETSDPSGSPYYAVIDTTSGHEVYGASTRATADIIKNVKESEHREKVKNRYGKEFLQEEAIVELLGMMVAERLDAVADKGLISFLKALFRQFTSYIKSLIKSKEIKVESLPDNLTLHDLADVFAYGNSKILLPGYEVQYTTPDNSKFTSYAEASAYISSLASSADIDLDSVTLPDFGATKEMRPDVFHGIGLMSDDYLIRKNGYAPSVILSDIGVNNLYTSVESLMNVFNALEDGYYLYNVGSNSFKRVTDSIEIDAYLSDPTAPLMNDSNHILRSFVEKNRPFEAFKKGLEEWKKDNNVLYDPEEIYSRGNVFVSALGAYSKMDVNLLLQNLIQHIEDNERAGGEFAISAFTRPKDRLLNHLDGGGSKIRFMIYPDSNDILWAAPIDAYSGSVWDASSAVTKSKQSELMGVSYSKYPDPKHANSIVYNLGDIVDGIAHAHNELGIKLNGRNFRLEYDDDVPSDTKRIIDSVNSVLDHKYGRITIPEIGDGSNPKIAEPRAVGLLEPYVKKYSLDRVAVDSRIKDLKGYLDSDLNKLTRLHSSELEVIDDSVYGFTREFMLNNSRFYEESPGKFVSTDGRTFNRLTEQQFYAVAKANDITVTEYDKTGVQVVKKYVYSYQGKNITDPMPTKERADEEKARHEKFYQNRIDKHRAGIRNLEEEIANSQFVELTTQAHINMKVAALKEVARRQPRSLITTRVGRAMSRDEYVDMIYGVWDEDHDPDPFGLHDADFFQLVPGQVFEDASNRRFNKNKKSKEAKKFKELPFSYNLNKLKKSTITLRPSTHAMGTYQDSASGKIVNVVPHGKFSIQDFLGALGITKSAFIKNYVSADQKEAQYMKDFLDGKGTLNAYRLDPVSADSNVLPEISDPAFAKMYDNRRRTIEILRTALRDERDDARRDDIRKRIRDVEAQAKILQSDESQTISAIIEMMSNDIEAVQKILEGNPDWKSLNYANSLLANYNTLLTKDFADLLGVADEATKLSSIAYQNKVEKLAKSIQDALFSLGSEPVTKYTGQSIMKDGVEIYGIDVSYFAAQTKDSTENINPYVQTITRIIKEALVRINTRFTKFKTVHEKVTKSLRDFQKSVGLKGDMIYDYMLQYDSEGKRTGNIVDELNSQYKKDLYNARHLDEELVWYAQNHTFDLDVEMWKKRKAELVKDYKNIHGVNVTLTEMDIKYGHTLETKIERRANLYAERFSPLPMIHLLKRVKEKPLSVTESDKKKFDAYMGMAGFRDTFVDGNKVSIFKAVPISKYRDAKWTAIQNMDKTDPRRVFFNHFVEKLAEGRYAMRFEDYKLPWNYIPEKTKKLPIGSSLRQWATDNLSQVIASNIHGIDPITGEISKAIPLYMLRGGISAAQKSYDLSEVLMSFTREHMNYEEKKEIEDDANLLLHILKNQKVHQLNPDGSPVVINGDYRFKEGVSNNYLMAKYRLDSQLYDERQDKEIITNIKMRDVATKKELKRIKGEMDKLGLNQRQTEDAHNHFDLGIEYVGKDQKIKDYIKLLKERSATASNFKKVTGNKVANTLMYFTSVKFLGLNLFAGMGEYLQGTLSLFTESASGRYFTDRQALRAYGMMTRISAPFDSPEKGKVKRLSALFDIEGKVFQESEQDNVVSKVGFFAYAMSNHVINNSFMIATLMNSKVKDKNGKEHSVFDVINIDESNNLSWSNPDIEVPLTEVDGSPSKYTMDLIFRVKEVVKNNRDRQTSDDPIILEKTMLGRILGQFKKNWLFRAFYSRFAEHREADNFSGMEYKGFYRSVWEMFAPVRTMDDTTGEDRVTALGILQGLGNGTSNLFKQSILGRVFGMKTDLEEIDEANVRKFLRELSFIVTTTAAIVLISSMGGDDDKDKSAFRTYVINQLTRLQRDITTYMSPSALASIVKNPAPVLSSVTDFTNIVYSAYRSTILMDPYVNEGTSREELRLKRAAVKNIPFVNQIDKMGNKIEKVINYEY